MSEVKVQLVENPRGKKRRHYTAKQKRAGFGGRRSMSGRKTSKRRGRAPAKRRQVTRRRNPSLMALTNPRRRSTRRRNPSMRGLFGMIDIQGAAFVATGAIGVNMAPGLIAKVWPGVPRVGIMGYAVKVGAAVGLGMATKMLTRSNMRAQQVVTGAVAMLLLEAFQTYAAPALGLGAFIDRAWTVPGARLAGFAKRNYVIPNASRPATAPRARSVMASELMS